MNKKSFFYHLFYVDHSFESSHDFRGEQGRRNREQPVCNCYSLCFATSLFICSWKQTYFDGKSRINTPDSVDSYIPTPSYQQNREYAWNSQHYHYSSGFSRWDSLYPCCNHENLSEQTKVRVNSFRF